MIESVALDSSFFFMLSEANVVHIWFGVWGFRVTNWRDRIKIAHLIFDDSVCTKPLFYGGLAAAYSHMTCQALETYTLKLEVSIWAR